MSRDNAVTSTTPEGLQERPALAQPGQDVSLQRLALPGAFVRRRASPLWWLGGALAPWAFVVCTGQVDLLVPWGFLNAHNLVAGGLGIVLGLACVPGLPLSRSSRVALAVVYVPVMASLLFLYLVYSLRP
jgi:hypothetical protein